MTNALAAPRATSAVAPSTCSRRGGARRMADASPIGSGATVTMPSAADVNQPRQTVKMSAVGSVITITAVPTDGRRKRSDNGGSQEPKNARHILELEYWTEPALDETGREQGAARIAQAKGDSEPESPACPQTGCNSSHTYASSHWPPGARPEGNQAPHSQPQRGPDHCDPFRLKQGEAGSCHQEIGDGGDDREPIACLHDFCEARSVNIRRWICSRSLCAMGGITRPPQFHYREPLLEESSLGAMGLFHQGRLGALDRNSMMRTRFGLQCPPSVVS